DVVLDSKTGCITLAHAGQSGLESGALSLLTNTLPPDASSIWAASPITHQVIGHFAGHARYSCSVSMRSQLSRCCVNPAEHVGEHHAGGAGCRASFASAGTRGGSTG